MCQNLWYVRGDVVYSIEHKPLATISSVAGGLCAGLRIRMKMTRIRIRPSKTARSGTDPRNKIGSESDSRKKTGSGLLIPKNSFCYQFIMTLVNENCKKIKYFFYCVVSLNRYRDFFSQSRFDKNTGIRIRIPDYVNMEKVFNQAQNLINSVPTLPKRFYLFSFKEKEISYKNQWVFFFNYFHFLLYIR